MSSSCKGGPTASARSRQLRAHLRDGDHLSAARCAKEMGRPRLSLCIYRRKIRGNRLLKEYLRIRDPVSAAGYAESMGRLDLALCIYRRKVGDYAKVADLMVKKILRFLSSIRSIIHTIFGSLSKKPTQRSTKENG